MIIIHGYLINCHTSKIRAITLKTECGQNNGQLLFRARSIVNACTCAKFQQYKIFHFQRLFHHLPMQAIPASLPHLSLFLSLLSRLHAIKWAE